MRDVYLRREVMTKHPVTGEVKRYTGSDVLAIKPLGVIIHLTGSTRMLIPWSRVEYFNYDFQDEEARKVIQEY